MPSAQSIEAARRFLPPNWKIEQAEDTPVSDEVLHADAVSPSPEELQSRFFKGGDADKPRYGARNRRKPTDKNAEMVTYQPPDDGSDPADAPSKALVTLDGKVIGAQG